MGMKLVHPYSVLSPPCAVQHCTPPRQAGGSLAVLEGRASPPHLNAGLRLTLWPILCSSTASLAIQYYINRAWGCFSLIPGLMRVAPWWGETKPSALSVVPAWAVQHCTPSRGGWQAFAAFYAWVSPPSSCWLPLCYPESASSCALHSLRHLPFLTFLSPQYQASHSGGVRMGHPHSVLGLLSAVQYCTPSQIGWQICSARCPDPAPLVQLLVTLVQPLDCHAPLHVSYMCSVLYILLLLAHMQVAPHWR